ncbi:hypothetical protein VYV02_004159 [Escherichia coli]|nr:hypothetical protein [Escherichia coli]
MNIIEYLFLLTPLWCYFLLLAIFTFIVIKKKYYKFNHEQLLKQKPFWMVMFVPFFSFLYFGFLSWWGHKPQFDSDGMINFLDISKVPLLILSLTLPLGALIANIHRTYQTEKQIYQSESKNLSDMYYAHNKYYIETLSKVNASREIKASNNEKIYKLLEDTNKLNISVSRPHSLYEKFYPNSSPKTGPQYEPSETPLLQIETFIDNALASFSALNSESLSQKINTGIDKNDKELSKLKDDLLTICEFIGVDNYIAFFNPFDIKIDSNKTQLKIALVKLLIICNKIYLVTSEIFNIIGVTKNTHSELIEKCEKLRTYAKKPYEILDKLKCSSRDQK